MINGCMKTFASLHCLTDSVKLVRLLSVCGALYCSTAFAVIVPSDRIVDWSSACVGVPGGITNRTTIYKTLPAGTSAGTINSTIASCPAGQVVLLAPGSYSGAINFGTKSGVTLRGSGTNTVITGTVIMGSGNWYTGNYPPYWSTGSTISSVSKGDTNVTAASTSGLAVGYLAYIDEKNDPSFVFDSNGSAPRARGQAVRITAISGNVVTFWPPLVYGFSSTQDARIKSQSGVGQIEFSSVEDLKLEGNGSTTGFLLENGYGCWLKGVSMHNMANYNLNLTCCVRCSIFGCDLRDAPDHSNNHFGIGLETSDTGILVENNIVWRIGPNVEINYASVGNVFAYNYFYDSLYATSGSMDLDDNHGPHNLMNLFEGNYIGVVQSDGYFGSSSHHTYLRNRITGTNPESNGKQFAVGLNRWARYFNFVGNLLGDSSLSKSYELVSSNPTGFGIYALGYPNIGNMGYDGTAPPNTWNNPGSSPGDNQWRDLAVTNTIIRHGNWDAVNKSIVWDPANSDHAIPASYYRNSKPTWFGNMPWPPYDPSATTAGNLSPTNIPAGYRFVYGIDPGSGNPGNQAPSAKATANPSTGPAPLNVSFSSSGSLDPEGTSLTYVWTFGDGGTSTAANPAHTYQSIGSYSAQLAVSDGTNTTQSSVITINATGPATNNPPAAASSASPRSGVVPLTVTFSSTGSSDPEGTPLIYSWAFGDGGTSTLANPAYTYQSTGTYSAVLTVSDGTNSRSATPVSITVVPIGGRPGGPVAAYGFEEGTGTSAADLSGNGNSATINGASWVSGKYGKGLSFDGTTGVVLVNDSATLDLTGAMTLEAWVYPMAINGGWQSVIFKPMDPAFTSLSYVLHGASRTTSVPSFATSGSSANLFGPAVLTANSWSHLAATYDGTTMQLYVNGTQVASQPQTGGVTTSTEPLRIGMGWSGIIDEVRIYNRALPLSEIQDDMGTSLVERPSPPTGLKVVGP
jgi:PKD repeat protein